MTNLDGLAGEFGRYLVVGGAAFVVDYGTLVLLAGVLGVHYLVAAALAFLAGLTFNYLLSIRWVFKKRTSRSAAAEFAVFAVIGIVGLGINEGVLALLTGVGGIHWAITKLVSTAIVLVWNFGARKIALFR
jgi:putative flippase GtrA